MKVKDEEWFSPYDRLPPTGDRVLCAIYHIDDPDYKDIEIAAYISFGEEGGTWEFDTDVLNYRPIAVYKWTELQEPPS